MASNESPQAPARVTVDCSERDVVRDTDAAREPHAGREDRMRERVDDYTRTESLGDVLTGLVRHPIARLVWRWNWKSALLSSGSRAALFFGANLSAGLDAAVAAMLTELIVRGGTAGFYGALTQAFSRATPRWAGTLAALVVLPVTGHGLELVAHWLRGTENLAASIMVSCLFTVVSTLFNLFAMRRGALIVGEGRASLGQDLRRMPRLIAAFIAEPVRLAARAVSRLMSRPAAAIMTSVTK